MKIAVVLKVRNGYLNLDNGASICKKENATPVPIGKIHDTIQDVYKEKPMIGKIDCEKL